MDFCEKERRLRADLERVRRSLVYLYGSQGEKMFTRIVDDMLTSDRGGSCSTCEFYLGDKKR